MDKIVNWYKALFIVEKKIFISASALIVFLIILFLCLAIIFGIKSNNLKRQLRRKEKDKTELLEKQARTEKLLAEAKNNILAQQQAVPQNLQTLKSEQPPQIINNITAPNYAQPPQVVNTSPNPNFVPQQIVNSTSQIPQAPQIIYVPILQQSAMPPFYSPYYGAYQSMPQQMFAQQFQPAPQSQPIQPTQQVTQFQPVQQQAPQQYVSNQQNLNTTSKQNDNLQNVSSNTLGLNTQVPSFKQNNSSNNEVVKPENVNGPSPDINLQNNGIVLPQTQAVETLQAADSAVIPSQESQSVNNLVNEPEQSNEENAQADNKRNNALQAYVDKIGETIYRNSDVLKKLIKKERGLDKKEQNHFTDLLTTLPIAQQAFYQEIKQHALNKADVSTEELSEIEVINIDKHVVLLFKVNKNILEVVFGVDDDNNEPMCVQVQDQEIANQVINLFDAIYTSIKK